jgi:type VI secretion system secreted protein VgrG
MLLTAPSPLTLQGALPPGLWVHWMEGREELGRLFQYELEIFSEAGEVALGALLGAPLTASLATEEGVRHFNGIVTRAARMADRDEFFVFRVVLSPRLWLLTRTRDCRIYQGLTVPEVVKAVLREHAIPFSERLQPDTYRRRDYLTQYRESDFGFVSRLMEEEGIYYHFRHTAERHELVLCDSAASHDPAPGYQRLPVRPRPDAKLVRDHLTGWRPVHQAASARVTLQDHDFRLRAGTDIRVVKAVGAEHQDDELESYDFPGGQVLGQNQDGADAGATRQAGEQRALVQLQEQRSRLERIAAEGNARGVEAGALLEVDVLPAIGKKFLITATVHRLRNIYFRSESATTPQQLCEVSLEAIEATRPFRPERVTSKPVIAGPQTATVVGKEGEEIWTDRYGRVKVQFPWDREGRGDEGSSCWVRVGQIWAGNNWGAIAIPRIGQEVIVQFLEGDPDRPLVTGSVYNVDHMPPYPLPAEATRSGIRTHSSKGGGPDNFNEIRFEDRRGAEELHLQAEKDLTTLVKHDQSTTVGNDQSAAVAANRSVSVGGNESHSVSGTRSLSVSGKDTQSFGNERAISVASADTHTIEGPRTEIYNGGRSREVKSFDTTTVEGGSKTTTVHGAYNVTADAQFQVQQGGNQLLIKDQVVVSSLGNVLVENPACQVSFSGGRLTLSAQTEISLVCGPASITLKSDGTITIDAPQNVTASSGGSGLELVPASATMSAAKATVAGQGITEIVGGIVKIN